MQAQWLDIPEEQNEHASHSHRCAVCGAFPPPPPPTLPGDGDIGGIEYLMMRGTWLRYMGLGKGTWFRIEFDGRRIISTPVYPPGFRVLHMPTSTRRCASTGITRGRARGGGHADEEASLGKDTSGR